MEQGGGGNSFTQRRALGSRHTVCTQQLRGGDAHTGSPVCRRRQGPGPMLQGLPWLPYYKTEASLPAVAPSSVTF